jgi:hypothetical protein
VLYLGVSPWGWSIWIRIHKHVLCLILRTESVRYLILPISTMSAANSASNAAPGDAAVLMRPESGGSSKFRWQNLAKPCAQGLDGVPRGGFGQSQSCCGV